MRVIDIESDRTKEILYTIVGSIHTVDKILISTPNNNLDKEKKQTNQVIYKWLDIVQEDKINN